MSIPADVISAHEEGVRLLHAGQHHSALAKFEAAVNLIQRHSSVHGQDLLLSSIGAKSAVGAAAANPAMAKDEAAEACMRQAVEFAQNSGRLEESVVWGGLLNSCRLYRSGDHQAASRLRETKQSLIAMNGDAVAEVAVPYIDAVLGQKTQQSQPVMLTITLPFQSRDRKTFLDLSNDVLAQASKELVQKFGRLPAHVLEGHYGERDELFASLILSVNPACVEAVRDSITRWWRHFADKYGVNA